MKMTILLPIWKNILCDIDFFNENKSYKEVGADYVSIQ
jgi:hypothetical protein